MRYTIVWTDKAIYEFAEVWLQSSNRQEVTDAARLIDRVLTEHPLSEQHEVVNGFGTAIRVPCYCRRGLAGV